jgi:4-hydroxybenzoate polyprenyltransferase
MLQKVQSKVGNYLSLVKFAHTVFALPFALTGYFMATVQEGGTLSLKIFILVIVCMFLARNAAMSFNRWADREFDRQNPRTAKREIPADIIKPSYALAFCLANAGLFIIATWFINPICFYLSPVALMVILGYSLTKRFTSLSHMVLGIGLALAPTGAYLAVCGHFSIQPVLLSLAVLCWVTGFDIIYALQDEDFDREYKLKSIPVALGRKKALGFSLLLHFLTTIFLLFVGLTSAFGIIYWVGFVVFNVLLFYQHWIVKPDDISKVNLAFFTLNGIASLLFASFSIADLLLRI